MTFEELWEKVDQLGILPGTAIDQIPLALSESTKRRLLRKTPEEIAAIIRSAVSEIDQGSIDTVDVLVRKRL